jgi:transposase
MNLRQVAEAQAPGGKKHRGTRVVENDLRGTLRNFGLKVGMVGKVKFEARIRELVENLPDLAVLVEPMLIVRRVVREQVVILHRPLLAMVRDDEVCRRVMTTPGVPFEFSTEASLNLADDPELLALMRRQFLRCIHWHRERR